MSKIKRFRDRRMSAPCMNPSCRELLDLPTGSGKRPMYCGSACRKAAFREVQWLEQQSKELLAQAECLPMGPERNHTLALYHDAEWLLLRYAGIRLEKGALKTTSI